MSLAFIMGLAGSALLVLLSLSTKRIVILTLSALLSSALLVQFLALGEGTAAVLSAVSLGYALVMLMSLKFTFLDSKGTVTLLLVAYTITFFALNGIAFNIQILAYVGSIVMVIVMLLKNPLHVKYAMLIAGVVWSIFQFNVGAYGQLVGQVFCFTGVFWSLYRLHFKRDDENVAVNTDSRIEVVKKESTREPVVV